VTQEFLWRNDCENGGIADFIDAKRRHSTVPVSEQNPVSGALALKTLHKSSAVQIKAVFFRGPLQTGGNALFVSRWGKW